MTEEKCRVCVTGGTGFIGSWIIKSLLEYGYSVNTTIRSNPGGNRDVSFLTNLPGASEKLQMFDADLSDPESFGLAVEGCVGIFHTATPIDFAVNEPEEVVTKRTINGALGILRAAVKSKTVKRVVYTSSASTVSFSGPERQDVVDESAWSDVDLLRSVKPFGWSYAVSKVLTEKAVLEFGEQNGLDVVSLVPPFVVGPFICPKLPDSVERALVLVFGKKEDIGVTRFHMLHVDDLARAHIFLLEHPNPKGRYNVSPFVVPIEEISELLSAKYPEYKIPSVDELKEIKGAKFPHLISKKLVDAGFEFKYSVEDMFEDAVECCKQKVVPARVFPRPRALMILLVPPLAAVVVFRFWDHRQLRKGTTSGTSMAWNVFKFCTSLKGLGSIMILMVLGVVGVTYYAVVLTNFGPALYLGGLDTPISFVGLILFHCLLVMVLWSYFTVVFTDPGSVPPNWKPAVDEERGEVDPLNGVELSNMRSDSSNVGIRHCRKCSQPKPARCHHCSVCGRCVLKMDHHCVWVVNCIGALNYKYFLLFLFYTFLETTLVTVSLLPHFKTFFTDGEITGTPGNLVATFLTFVLNLAFSLSVLGFLAIHVSLVVTNTTTIEAYEKKTSPKWRYDLGLKKNFEQVFGMDKRYWFIPVYSEEDIRRMPVLQGLEYPSTPDFLIQDC
ncbi:unnamed protein product [Sphenostylis stenocarpa]|uniref:S-acyltransferase n=1 Tax=Sphenostylis stenocarpa TaxID=92480 RepID=A0AA86V8S4_9FABA|nr:unnamed protein product [Sphenostylis stenocarpa]